MNARDHFLSWRAELGAELQGALATLGAARDELLKAEAAERLARESYAVLLAGLAKLPKNTIHPIVAGRAQAEHAKVQAVAGSVAKARGVVEMWERNTKQLRAALAQLDQLIIAMPLAELAA